jgi:hypothetical protein
MRSRLSLLATTFALLAACDHGESSPPPAASSIPSASSGAPAVSAPKLSRADFNRFALRMNIPLFWGPDANGNGLPDRAELRTLLFYPTSDSLDIDRAVAAITAFQPDAMPAGLSPAEVARRKLVAEDLDQGALAVLYTDLRASSATDKSLLNHILVAAKAIDAIYGTVTGGATLASRVPTDDAASQSLFRRDWGPNCAGAKTHDNPLCTAIPGGAKATNDAYPASLQSDPGFCAKLQQDPATKTVVSDHFGVVREQAGKLASVPYTEAYAAPMKTIATELHAAAVDETDPGEAALKAYLDAAATSFTTNDWGPADEAWSKMNAQNSKWYLRVAPDEVLSDPCSLKAQFHLNLARIDQSSLKWQSKLTPLEDDMERALAALIGPAYTPRKVTFHLPDFIEVVLNAGDDRQPVGATAGESLPNWGKVETEGRGRTVAMTNIGSDPDGKAVTKKRVESLFDADSAKLWTPDDEPARLNTILHEATHNLGPTLTYAFQGKRGDAVFGGGLASMLEELKAETGAMYWIDWLGKKGVVEPQLAKQAYAAWLEWSLRHISLGVHTGQQDQAYGQLAAIEVGFLLDEGALTFDAATPAANGADKGAFAIHLDKMPAAFEKLMKVVGTLKAKNDKPAADALAAKYLDGPTVPMKLIAERELRFPQTTVAYSVDR